MLKFKKDWGDYSVTLILSAVPDPQIKHFTLEYCYTVVDQFILKLLYFIFEKYYFTPTSSIKNPSSVSRKNLIFLKLVQCK